MHIKPELELYTSELYIIWKVLYRRESNKVCSTDFSFTKF